jgi:hypothetical protein
VTGVVAPLTGTVTSVVSPLTGTVTGVVAPLTGTVTSVVAPLTGTVFTAAGAPAPVSGAGVLGVAGSLPAAGAMRGFLINTFYFAPAKAGRGENYGLVFNAPLEAVADAFPELAPRETINGHLRRLLRLSDETGDRSAGRKTLLICSGGTET